MAMRQRPVPLLFEDDDREAGRRKAQTREAPEDLASVVVNYIRRPGPGKERTTAVTKRTRLQNRAFQLLEVNPDRTVPINETV